MSEEERYFWDLTGYTVIKGLMTPAELAAANAAVDVLWDQIEPGGEDAATAGSQALRGSGRLTISDDAFLLQLQAPHCDPFRRMLAHPAVVGRLNLMCGKGFRFDHGPHFIGGEKGTVGLRMHGAGDPHRPYVAYHHHDGQMFCGGVTVSWNLADVNTGDGGFACVPGSHKSRYPMPKGVQTCDDDMGVVEQPTVAAGDVLLFMDGAQTHGTHPWTSDAQRRAVLFKYASRTSTRTGASTRLAPPEIYWGPETVEGMTAEQRAVMYGPCASSEKAFLSVSEDGKVSLD